MVGIGHWALGLYLHLGMGVPVGGGSVQIWNPTIFGHSPHPQGHPCPMPTIPNHVNHSHKFMIQPRAVGNKSFESESPFPRFDFPNSLIMGLVDSLDPQVQVKQVQSDINRLVF